MATRGDFGPVIRGEITRDHFLTEAGKIICEFCLRWHTRSEAASRFPSLIILQNRFKKSGFDLPEPDPGDDVNALAFEVITQKARRDISTVSSDLSRIAAMPDPLEHLPEAVAVLKRTMETVQKSKHASIYNDIGEILTDYDTGDLMPQGVPWPWATLQKATHGLQRKEVVAIVARPKQKKTFTALKVMAEAFISGENVLVFTPESPPRQLLVRVIAAVAGIRYTEFKDRALDQAELARLLDVASQYGKADEHEEDVASLEGKGKLHIVQSTGRSVSWMQSQIAVYKPRIILADSFYRQLPDGGQRYDQDWKQVTAVSRAIKDISMEENITSVITHQLNKGAAGVPAGLEHIAFADALGQDADLILHLLSGMIEGIAHTAVRVIGGREVSIDGILIKSVPYSDYGEAGIVLDNALVKRLLDQGGVSKDKKKPAKSTLARASGKS